ncbi:T9SS type A sorting domain-containing protein [uncultured Polaribacter sp.]|uniref:T9SS type A sorting domain-containing protein n=1 Tax=uncultured Polaribacter sp. TaxID=174711 RepID=UPI0030D95E8F|tara:strand:+ start:25707 stop:26321 length:615 start_codon:yes stop_codon:yes gene_type:complete
MTKKLLFITLFFVSFSMVAQTNTITIDWSFNSTPSASGNANASRTIEVGDTVTWNWYASGTHNVKSNTSAKEQFESEFFGNGGTFSHTFTSIGTNDYICQPHPSTMFGTITVVAEGVLNTNNVALLSNIRIYPNPASSRINFNLNNNEDLNVKIYNLLGKEVLNSSIDETNNSISVATLSKGMYIAKIMSTDGKSFSTKRFVKQ